MLSLTQKWNMFAPYPRKRDSWLLVPGLTTQGELVYLETGSPAMSEKVETELKNIQVFDNYRWRKYLHRLIGKGYKKYRQHYGRWLCENWRHPQQPDVGLAGFFMYNKTQHTPLPGAARKSSVSPARATSCLSGPCARRRKHTIDPIVDVEWLASAVIGKNL